MKTLSPGPWYFERDRVGRYWRIYSANDVSVCRVYRESDARMIAVLPALVRIAIAVNARKAIDPADMREVFTGGF